MRAAIMSNALELRIPPVALVVIAALAMWALALGLPPWTLAIPMRGPLAVLLALAGAGIAMAGVAEFRRAHTTVNPTTPEASSSVVDSGIYRRSRNPMYLGFLLVLAGWAVYLDHLAALPVLPVFALYMNRFQIAPEERALRAKFGAPYAEYTRRVRRWL